MKKPPEIVDFRANLRRLLIVPIGALLVVGGLLSFGILELVRSARWVDHTDQVIAKTHQLQALMIDEETGVRGFLLSRDPVSLEPWNAAKSHIGDAFDQLAQLVRDNPPQEQRLEAIRERHAFWEQTSKQQMAEALAGNMQGAGVVLQGKQRMDDLRSQVHEFLETENQLRRSRGEATDRDLHLLLTGLGVLALGLGLGVALWLFRGINSLNKSFQDQADATYRDQQWLQTTLRAMCDGVIATDVMGCIIFMNPEAESATGWTEAEAKGRPFTDVVRTLSEETRTELESLVTKVQRTGTACGLGNRTILIRKVGSEVHVSGSGAPIRGSEGDIAGIVLVFRDIGEQREAERAAAASEQRFRTLFDLAPIGFALADASTGSILMANAEMTRIVGYSQEELKGLSSNALTHPDDVEANKAFYYRVQQGSHEHTVIKRYVRKDGQAVWVRVHIRILPGSGDQPSVVFGAIEDITETRQAEQALRESEERYRFIAETAQVGYWDWNILEDQLEWDPVCKALFGIPEDEPMSYRRFLAAVHPDDRERTDKVVRACLSGFGEYDLEYRSLWLDQAVHWIHAKGNARFIDGQAVRMAGIAIDVSARALVEQELREKSELIDLVQSAINAGYWSYFPVTGKFFLSPGERALFGFPEIARPTLEQIAERIHPADREAVLAGLQTGMESGEYFAEFRIHQGNGALRWISGQGRVLSLDRGEKYMVGINFDITNQKLSEEALRKSEKLAVAGRLAATISHEINNPLEAVTNLLYLLRTNCSDAQSMELIATAEEELARVSQVVTHSLRFHRQSTQPSYEKLSSLLEAAASIYKNRFTTDHVETRRSYRDQKSILCYPSELRQVFGNLVGNALDATRHGDIIYLRTRDAVHPITGEPGVRVAVADTGHGMDANTLQRISEPFFTTKETGTGLGLWISRDILKKHSGVLRVRSRKGEGVSGTVISVFLPVAAIQESSSVVIQGSGAPRSGT